MTDDPRYASRKFRAFLLVLAIGVGMELGSKLSPQLAELLKWSLAIYCGFNVTQKAGEWIAQLLTTKKEAS